MKPADVLRSRIDLLDDDAKVGLMMVLERLVSSLETGEGCAVTFIDVHGDGRLSVLALGNQELVDPLIGAAAEIHRTINERPEGPLQ